MRTLRLLVIGLALCALTLPIFTAHAQTRAPLVDVITIDGEIAPSMFHYVERGLQTAEVNRASLIVLQLNTPGGDLESMLNIMDAIRASDIPVVVYVSPKGAIAGSAGALITMAGDASAMAPETAIGASSPISSSGQNLETTLETKQKEIMKAKIRSLVAPRGPTALELAQSMIDDAKAVTAQEALDAKLVDFIATDLNDLLKKLDGFTVQMGNGPRTLHTADAVVQNINLNFIEQLLFLLTDANILFILIAIGLQAIVIEISHPGGWAAGFLGVICLALAVYGMGILPVNWFGLIFIVTAFILFILDLKAPTHGALTTAGVGSFIVGALVLFNSPGTPQFQRVSVPLVIVVGILFGLIFAAVMTVAIRAQRAPVRVGMGTVAGKIGTVRDWSEHAGQVQVGSELWSAEPTEGSGAIRKGDHVEVVKAEGLRLKVKKKE